MRYCEFMRKQAGGSILQTFLELKGAGLCLMLAAGALAGGVGGVVAAKVTSKSPEDVDRLKAEYDTSRMQADADYMNAMSARRAASAQAAPKPARVM